MAGYERQNTQTHYLAEYGVMAAMQDLAPSVAGNVINNAMCGDKVYSRKVKVKGAQAYQPPIKPGTPRL